MKNFLVLAALFLLAQSAHAQLFSIGLKGGINTQINKPDDITVPSGDSSFNVGVDRFKFGTQFGVFVRLGNKLYLQPELLFNSTKTDYKVKGMNFSDIKNEKYRHLDLPLLVGIKVGPLRLHGGPVGHYFLNSSSELTDLKGYKAHFQQFTWGWLTGISVGTGRISADLRYEGNFKNSDNSHLTFFGDQYNFSKTPARFILGVNIAIVK